MIERRGTAELRRALGRSLLLAAALVAAACGGPAASPAPPVPAAGSPGPPSAAAPSIAPTVTAAPSASVSAPAPSASAVPSGVPVLDPERCPPTLPTGVYATADGMQIEGDAVFTAHVEKALDLVKAKAPDAYADVTESVVMIRQVDAFSGMCYNTGSYRVGEETAYAPGHPKDAQVVWLAGTIVHDACHRARFVAGETPSGRDAELACLKLQVAALRKIDERTQFSTYVQGLIDGVDDPANQYWTNPNRHW